MKRLLHILRILIGVLLIIFLFARIDLRSVLNHILSVDIKFLLFASIPYFIFIMISAWRWKILLDYKGMGVGFGDVLKVYFIHLFFNNFLPSNVGGDLARIAFTIREGRRAEAIGTVIVDRILGFFGLFIFGFFSVFLLYLTIKKVEFLAFLIIGSFIILAVATVAFSERIYRFLSPILLRIKLLNIGQRAVHLYETFIHFGKARRPMVYCVIISFFVQALLAYVPYLILQALPQRFPVTLLSFFIYIPIINILVMIPVSVGGIGIRENSYVFLFKRVNLPADAAVSVSLLFFLISFIFSLPGGILFLTQRVQTKN
ncbi:MAG: lysylphosphatidylglycerol synthase transmembrane domain-containing protein [candidate division WOR-3 bacterium]